MSSGSYLWGPLAPFLVAELAVSKAQFGAVQSAFYVVGALMAVPAGVLADRFDGRWLLLACLLAMAIPLALLSGANTLLTVTVLAGLCGLGNGAINQVGARGVLHWFPPQRRATAMGLRQTGNMLGAALAAAALPGLALCVGLAQRSVAGGGGCWPGGGCQRSAVPRATGGSGRRAGRHQTGPQGRGRSAFFEPALCAPAAAGAVHRLCADRDDDVFRAVPD